ncbi:MAG: TIGR03013 family PEP-CTERM/XrtA system glycosyltransferase [Betaproteobacteria bacterium]|nr:TIGR03013 family PEP-CTERM/XrtA system glycosyltransferase [Betaproteobacteria bacterium]
MDLFPVSSARGLSAAALGAEFPARSGRNHGQCVGNPGQALLAGLSTAVHHEFRSSVARESQVFISAPSAAPPERMLLLTASLVGVGGIPLFWGWRRVRRQERSEPQTARGAVPHRGIRILIFGVGANALEVRDALATSNGDVEIVGFYPSLQEEEEQTSVEPSLILPTHKSLTETARALGVDEIVVAVAQRRGGVLPLRELLDCRLHGICVRDMASHFEHWQGQIRLDSLKAGWLIFGGGFSQSSWRWAIKSVFDMVCSGILLLLTLPVMALTAVAIVVENGFPIFYRQERVGLNGRTFNVIKFRSMRTDAEKDGRPRWAQAGDNRVTRVGRIIRKLRIDELPQLFSVFNGDMSLVGPRPERPFFVDQLTRQIPFYAVRHSIKPGVTGWAQVRYHYGASVEDAAQKLQYDLYYVKNHSLLLDLKILLGTVSVVVLAKGA